MRLWNVQPDTPVTSLAVGLDGTVYVTWGGDIYRYNGSDGSLIDQMQYSGGWGFDSVAIGADNSLTAAWYKGSDDIVRFAPDGSVDLTITGAFSSVTNDSELDMHVAVDGLGTIYALGTFTDAVFVYSPDGRYQARFGSSGDQPGQFRAPDAIAIDGQSRVYVSDFNGINVFAPDGRFIDLIPFDGVAFGMVFDQHNNLYVAARDHVTKLAITAGQ